MKIIEPKVELLPELECEDGHKISTYCRMIERVAKIARLCYRSERSTNDLTRDCEFAHNLYDKGHTSVFEHIRVSLSADLLIPSWKHFNTAEKIVDMVDTSKRKNKMIYAFAEARSAFYEIIHQYTNRTSVSKNIVEVSLSCCHQPILEELGACFSINITNVNLRELINMFNDLTYFIGNYFGRKYCDEEYDTTSFWEDRTRLFQSECIPIFNDAEHVLLSIAVALWRALYVKFSDYKSDTVRKNIFETISNKEEFIQPSDMTRKDDEILSAFTVAAKRAISDMKNDTIYRRGLKSAMSYMSSDRTYDENKNIRIVTSNISYTFYIETNRGVLAELTRHRCLSPTVESTRYVNYSKTDKYGEMCFTDHVSIYNPNGIDTKDVIKKNRKKQRMLRKMYAKEERMYNKLIKNGFTPQEARNVLPNGLVSRMYVTGDFYEWMSFFSLRNSPNAHPDIREIATMIGNIIFFGIRNDIIDLCRASLEKEEDESSCSTKKEE